MDNSFTEMLKQLENRYSKGYNPMTYTWAPHQSVEGGTPTLGYGHKMTDKELNSKNVIVGGKTFPMDNITTKDAEKIFELDWKRSNQEAEKWIGPDWKNLDPAKQAITAELFFNMGYNKASEFKNYKEKILANDPSFIDEINRTGVGNRVNEIKNWYNNYQTKEFTGSQSINSQQANKINQAMTAVFK